jgi:DNA helicase-2/ATP-dependent DNA helicase PcrA
MDFLSTLNQQQREAVTATDGPLLILAGAGSGKTRVITFRIAYLIAENKVAPHNILAVTFTNKAAGEMRERVEKLLRGVELRSAPLVSTFHSLCVRILRQDIESLREGYTKSFTIYDQDDSVRLVKGCIRDLGFDEKQIVPRITQGAISKAKNRGEDPQNYAAKVEYADEKRVSIAQVFKLYEQRLANNNALDFDDLLIKTVQLLRRVSEVREKYNDKFKYILVDEYQDTNSLQFAMIRYLTEKQTNICVVGDPDQSIYKFRAADIRNILEFEEHYPDTKTIRLEQNYRSTQTILDVADSVVSNNTERKEKKLWTSNPTGEKVRYYQAFDSDSEARFVAAKIQEHFRHEPNIRAAVLYRTNAQSRVFEEALRRNRIDYNIVGGFSFYERAEVKDIIAYLKVALNPHDSIALMRVINTPARGLGKQTLDDLERKAKEFGVSYWEAIAIISEQGEGFNPRAINSFKNFQKIINGLARKVADASRKNDSPVSDVVKAAIFDTGYEATLKAENTDEADARLANLEELVNAAVDYDKQEQNGLRDFIDHAALVSDTDQYKANARVTLMTMHAAKGLEFPLVFIVGMEDGVFPHSRSINDPQELEEERRLCYVAITRAEQHLYLTHAMRRRVYGDEIAAEPSQFLNEMPLDLIEDLSRGNSWLGYAKSSTTQENKRAINALRGERDKTEARPRTSNYTGKTYDSVEAIAEFFRQKKQQTPQPPTQQKSETLIQRLAAKGNEAQQPSKQSTPSPKQNEGGIVPGARVRHPKYGTGLVLRREGSGDSVKLTVNFPGFGQKKLIEKFAGLEKA